MPLLLRSTHIRGMCSYIPDFGSAILASLCGIVSRTEENDEEEKEENEEAVALTTWDAVSRFYYVNGKKNYDSINK